MKMTNKGILRGMLAVTFALALGGCVLTGTGTVTEAAPGTGRFGEHARTPVKDFQAVGMVFTETTLTSTANGDEGQIFTWQALLKEAEARGADAIINVVIDKKIQTRTSSGIRSTTWYGSALAVKYTDTLTETESVTTSANGTTTTTVTTSVYFNEDSGVVEAGEKTPPPAAGGFPRLPIPAPKPAPAPASAPAKGLRQ